LVQSGNSLAAGAGSDITDVADSASVRGKKTAPTSANYAPRESNHITRKLGLITVIALLMTGALTFIILFGLTPLEPNENVVRAALIANSMLALVLVALIIMEVLRLLRSRRKGRAAARLHIRIVGLFALVAALPAIMVAIVASVTLDLGLDRWFEIRTKEIVQGSVSVAQAYVDESARVHINATVSMASELDRARRLYSLDRTGFIELMNLQTRGRGMIAAELVRADGEVVISSRVKEDVELPSVPEDSLEAADTGDVIFIPRGRTNIIGSVLKMRAIPDVYLYTIRPMREDVLLSLRQMEENTNEYTAMENSRLPVQLTFAVLYLAMALMILLAAIWMGISVADRFVRPIRRLIDAADEVSSGNLDVSVDTQHTEGDFKNLGDTFNTMTTQLKQQRGELLKANKDIDDRARFTEAVLSGVSASVIGVDEIGTVKIANLSTKSLFGLSDDTIGNIKDILPELAVVLDNARNSGKAEYREQISAMIEGQSRNLNVQVTQESDAASDNSFVITIDDITDLVVAQRSTAWSDIARRIAHEIKNPLTPIQLSAERIRKRYRKYITEDTEVFDRCTDTIIRQVGDIGRMVDEFSSFARMPKPEMAKGDIGKTLQEALFTQKVANAHINYSLDLGEEKNIALFDDRLMSQALINLIKNAGEAIDAVPKTDLAEGEGQIEIRTWHDKGCVVIDIIDNGKGLPEEDRQKLLEPYMTTRQKGTGLGLAIVRKILEDHGGTIELMDAPSVASGGRGAMMRLRIPLYESSKEKIELLNARIGKGEIEKSVEGMGRSALLQDSETDNKVEKEATS
jgi:two-component system nitrogen regulation sensor histidine kinase NtrY